MYFAEIGDIPKKYTELPNEGKSSAVLRRRWRQHFRNWGAFVKMVKEREPELCKLALEVKEVKPDPLAALRASTKEK